MKKFICVWLLIVCPVAAADDPSVLWLRADKRGAGGTKEITKLKKLFLEVPVVIHGRANSVIFAPQVPEYVEAAGALQSAVEEKCRVKLPIADPAKAHYADLKKGTPILIGSINTNHLIVPLYFNKLCYADDLYPGAGGYTLRTVHDPFGTGNSIVVIGASDGAGAKAGANAFIGKINELGTRDSLVLPKTMEYELGGLLRKYYYEDRKSPPRSPSEESRERIARELKENLPKGGRWVLQRAMNAAQDYALWGYDTSARIFWDYLSAFKKYNEEHGHPIDGRHMDFFEAQLGWIMTGWDVVEESPTFTDEERLEITRYLLDLCRTCAQLGYFQKMRPNQIRHNHQTFPGIALFWSARYFNKYYDLNETRDWTELADRMFAPQLETSKPQEDSSSYWLHPMHHVLEYALAKPALKYFENGSARRAAELSLLCTNNLGAMPAFGDTTAHVTSQTVLWPTAWAYNDPSLLGHDFVIRSYAQGMTSAVAGVGRPYAAYNGIGRAIRNMTPAPNDNLLGVRAHALDPKVYAHVELTEKELPPIGKAFDKISFRRSFDPNDAYLLLDGHGRGYHGHFDGNAILEFSDNGRVWLGDRHYIISVEKNHNMLLVLKDGLQKNVPALASLEHLADLETVGFTSTKMSDYNGLDWTRSILWRKGEYFLITDTVTAREAADYTVKVVFRGQGTAELSGRRLQLTQQGDEKGFIVNDGRAKIRLSDDPEEGERYWRKYTYGDGMVRVLHTFDSATLAKGESLSFSNLVYAKGPNETKTYDLSATAGTAKRLRGSEEAVFALASDGFRSDKVTAKAAAIYLAPARWALVAGTELSCGERLLSADCPVSVEVDCEKQLAVLVCDRDCTVALSSEPSRKFAKGEHKIEVSSEVAAVMKKALGEALASKALSPEPARRLGKEVVGLPRLKVAWRATVDSDATCLAAGRPSADNAPLIAGSKHGMVAAFDEEGKELWRFQTDVLSSKTGRRGKVWQIVLADIDGDGTDEIIVGAEDRHVHVLSRDGREKWRGFLPPFHGSRKGEGRSLMAGDITGDEKLEIVVGSTWNHHAFDCTGKMLWTFQTFHGSTAGVTADVDGDGKDEVFAGTEYYWWYLIDGEGNQLGRYNRRPPGLNIAAASDVDGDGRSEIILGTAAGTVDVLGGIAKLKWKNNLGGAVYALDVGNINRDKRDEIVAGGDAFELYAFDGTGNRLWRTHLGDVINAVRLLPGKKIIAATDSGLYEVENTGKAICFEPLPGAIAVVPGASGIRAAALARDGTLVGIE